MFEVNQLNLGANDQCKLNGQFYNDFALDLENHSCINNKNIIHNSRDTVCIHRKKQFS